MNGNHEEKDLEPNLAKPKPSDGYSKQGWKTHAKKGKTNKNNKQPKVEDTAIDENRYSRLKDVVEDITEVTQSLSEAVIKQNNGDEQIESKNEKKTSNRIM